MRTSLSVAILPLWSPSRDGITNGPKLSSCSPSRDGNVSGVESVTCIRLRANHSCNRPLFISRNLIPRTFNCVRPLLNCRIKDMRACTRGVEFYRNSSVVCMPARYCLDAQDRLLGFRPPRMRVKSTRIRSLQVILIYRLTHCSLPLSSYRDNHTDYKTNTIWQLPQNSGYGVGVSLR